MVQEQMSKYDLIIVGCGFAGATIANLAAGDGKKVLIVEKRNHIAGNMYDEVDESGILIQKYGPHSFHTYEKKAYDYVTSFSEWDEYILRARVDIDGKMTPSPFNTKTIEQYFEKDRADEIKKHLEMCFPNEKKTTIVKMLKSEDEVVREYANFLFEKDYRPYTSKQWGIKPEELDISILERVPVRLDDKDAYFDDPYQVIPKNGFTEVFRQMLDSENINVRLNEDAFNHLEIDSDKKVVKWDGEEIDIPVVYTGPIDELFALKYGRLPYRSLYFDFQTHNVDSFQECSGVAYPMAEGYTRITEFKKIPYQNVPGVSVVAVEYPAQYMTEKGKEPYYPILTDESKDKYQKYLEESQAYENLYLCGRLAEFKYYNMDNVVLRAMDVYEGLRERL